MTTAQTITTSIRDLVAAANGEIETLPLEETHAFHGRADVVFIDLRDVRELGHDGKIARTLHVPRGMLEFWIDPASPYHKPVFAEDNRFVFYCASAWRSALATKAAQDMGLAPVCHFEGGFNAWKEAGLPLDSPEPR